MSKRRLAAAVCAAALVWGTGTAATADNDPLWPGTPIGLHSMTPRNALPVPGLAQSAGPWTFEPVIAFRHSDDPYAEIMAAPTAPSMAGLGFRGAARVDSRIGTFYSRLSLTFEHEFQANGHRVVTGLSGAGRYGFYADRSEVDVVAADAALALRMSEAVFGYLEYESEVEPGASAKHQVTIRLRFAF